MKDNFPLVLLKEVLTERREEPSYDDILDGKIKIVEKIRFESGEISLRQSHRTNTKMILSRPGDMLISGINATKGAIAIYDPLEKQPIAATIHYCSYIINKNMATGKFIWWLLRSDYFKKILSEFIPGGIKTELKAKRLLNIPIPLPSIPEQESIVIHVDKLYNLTSEAISLRYASGKYAKLLMSSSIEKIMSQLSATGKLEDVITFKPRSGPSFVTNPDWTGTPVLMPSSVSGFGVDINKIEFGSGLEKINLKDRLNSGDIIIARGNKTEQVGNAGVVPDAAEGWVCANLLMRFRINPERTNPHFLIYWLRSPRIRNIIRQEMSGTNPNIQKINQKKILNIPFPASTPLSRQNEIVKRLDSLQFDVDNLITIQNETSKHLTTLFPILLNNVFNNLASSPNKRKQPVQSLTGATNYFHSIASQLTLCDIPNNLIHEKSALTVYIAHRCRQKNLGRVKIAKLYYFAHKIANITITDHFARKAAGPLDSQHNAIFRHAIENRWLLPSPEENISTKEKQLKPVILGPNIQEALETAKAFLGPARGKLNMILDDLKQEGWEILELWATVLDAALELKSNHQDITPQAIRRIISQNPEWTDKLKRPIFSEHSINNALFTLHRKQYLTA